MDLLQTERLILRELQSSDADRVHHYANESDINRYLIFGDLATTKGAQNYVRRAIENASREETDQRLSFKLAILLKPERDFIGSCWLDINDKGNRRATIGYFIDNRYWGKGYATEAARSLIKFGFKDLGLHRVEATCDAEHNATRRVLEKAGMKREAILRQHRKRRQTWADSCLYAIIDDL